MPQNSQCCCHVCRCRLCKELRKLRDRAGDVRAREDGAMIEAANQFLVFANIGGSVVWLGFEKRKRRIHGCTGNNGVRHVESREHSFDVSGLIN